MPYSPIDQVMDTLFEGDKTGWKWWQRLLWLATIPVWLPAIFLMILISIPICLVIAPFYWLATGKSYLDL